MANYAQRELAIAASNGPPSAPNLAPDLRESPRPPSDTEHRAARAKWIGYPNQAKRSLSPNEFPSQSPLFTICDLRIAPIYARLGQAFRVSIASPSIFPPQRTRQLLNRSEPLFPIT